MVFRLKYQRAKGAKRGQKSPPSNFCVNKHFKFKADAKRVNKATNHFVVRRQQIQRSAKIPTMGCTLRTAHCRDFLLAEVDVCLITTKQRKGVKRLPSFFAIKHRAYSAIGTTLT